MHVIDAAATRTWRLAAGAVAIGLLSGCAPIVGFPNDPAANSRLSSYYGPDSETAYDKAVGEEARRATRDMIVRHRLHGYDLEYSEFKRALASQGNIASVGGGLAVLTLSGIAATTGHLATAGAMAAATAGIVGAQGLINKELYFQKTLPALVAQMDAARDKIIASILTGLGRPDADYSLVHANMDLAKLKDAGSIEGAISTINEEANTAKAKAADAITTARDATYVMTHVPRGSVQQQLGKLSGAEVVKLANRLLADFRQRPEAVRKDATLYLPNRGATFIENQTTRARQFLVAWIEAEVMSPDRLDYWTKALKAQ